MGRKKGSQMENPKREWWKISRKFQTQVYLFAFKLLRVKISDYDTNSKEVYNTLITFLGHFAHLAVYLLILGPSFYIKGHFDYAFFICLGCSIVGITTLDLIIAVSMIFKTKRPFLTNCCSFFLGYIPFTGYMLSSSIPLESSFFYCFLILPPLLTIANNGPRKVFWIIFNTTTITCIFTYQVIRTVIGNAVFVVSLQEQIFLLAGQFVAVLLMSFFAIFYQIIPHFHNKDFQKKVSFIANAISRLDFKGEQLQELLTLPDVVCSTTTNDLKQVVRNVIEYKTYLPSHLLGNDSESASNYNNSASQDDLTSTVSSTSKDSKGSKNGDDSSDSEDSSHKSQLYSRNNKRRNQIISDRMFLEYGSFMLIELVGWEQLMFAKNPKSSEGALSLSKTKFVECVKRWVEIVEDQIVPSKGILINYLNDRIYVCWNIKRICTNHELRACQSAIAIREALKKDEKTKNIQFRISISTGEAFIGNLGSSITKRGTFFGECINHLKLLAYKYNDFNCEQSVILIDDTTFQRVKFEMKVLFVNRISVKNTDRSIYLLTMENKIKKNEEWMYVIAEKLEERKKNKENQEEMYNLSFDLEEKIIKKEFLSALTILGKLKTFFPSVNVFERLENNLKSKAEKAIKVE